MSLCNSSEILDMRSTKISHSRESYQSDLPQFEIIDPIEIKVSKLDEKLSLCGRFATKNFYCKKDTQHEHLIRTSRKRYHCEIRYCVNPDCLVERFARNLETFNDIKRLEELRKLWHFVIGFEPIPLNEFQMNFSEHKKRMEYVLNSYLKKLKDVGINIQAIRILDFSFVSEGLVYLHYHFATIPIGQRKIRSTMITMQQLRKGMIEKMKTKTPFHFESFGLASKKGVLSYLAIRASGMYRYDMTKNPNYEHVKVGNLRESIEKEKYVFLKDFISKEQYLKHFYKKMHFVTIGGLPRPFRHGSNITDDIKSGLPTKCLIHGDLERKDIRVEIIFEESSPPPDSQIKTYPELEIEVIRIR